MPQRPIVMTSIGIDPGASGAIVVLGLKAPRVLRLQNATRQEILEWLKEFGIKNGVRLFTANCMIEKVGGYVGSGEGEKGGGPANGSAMFSFGRSYGNLEMALLAAGIPFEEVTPHIWQSSLGIRSKLKRKKAKNGRKGSPGETRSQFKRRLRERAQALFPGEKLTADVADAYLIALYCQRRATGTLDRTGAAPSE